MTAVAHGYGLGRQLAGPDVVDPVPVVVVTTFDLDDYVQAALKGGSAGSSWTAQTPRVQAIHAAAAGDALIAPDITARLLAAFARRRGGAPPRATFRAACPTAPRRRHRP